MINIIKSIARDVGTLGVDQYIGYGIVDAAAALKAPKGYFLLAGINRVEVVQKGGAQAVRVHGTAAANAMKSANIEIAQGESPHEWTRVGPAQRSDTADGVLGDIPAARLKGAKVWQIRVLVEHDNGCKREARFKLTVG